MVSGFCVAPWVFAGMLCSRKGLESKTVHSLDRAIGSVLGSSSGPWIFWHQFLLWLLLLLLSRFSRVWLCARPHRPGSPVPGILQARILEWVAISFSRTWKWKVKVKSLSRVRLSVNSWTAAYQASMSMGFSRQEYWSGVLLPSPSKSATLVFFIWAWEDISTFAFGLCWL